VNKINKQHSRLSPAYLALAAALLFGGSTPASKLLLAHITPQLLAGLLYCASGLGLFLYKIVSAKLFGETKEKALKRSDIPSLAGAIVSGGVIAPLLLLIGLTSTAGAAASLLLNFEGVFTALLAWFAFKEHFDRRIIIGMLAIVLGGILLSWVPGAPLVLSPGSLYIIAATLFWGLDNNFTRNISASDPVQVAAIKGLIAGFTNCFLAVTLGSKLPTIPLIILASLTGFIGYGISLSLYVKALRFLGTSRTGAYFSTAPFAGAFVSLIVLKDPITINFVFAAFFMAIGVWLHLSEKHEHEHTHEAMEHEHLHIHDEHHQHEHSPQDSTNEPHSHVHNHKKITHSHAHFPDIHHRHEH
jgi:drug/metabolite transporter (DMT)-like permease